MDQNQPNTKTTAIVAGVVLFAFLVVFLFLWKVAGPVVAVIITVFIFLFTGVRLLRWSMQKKKRQAALANLRPDAVLIDGKSPSSLIKKGKLSGTGGGVSHVTLAITPDAVEIWSARDLTQPTRSIPNHPAYSLSVRDVQYGRESGSEYEGSRPRILRSLVVEAPDGYEFVFAPSFTIPEQVINQIIAARAAV